VCGELMSFRDGSTSAAAGSAAANLKKKRHPSSSKTGSLSSKDAAASSSEAAPKAVKDVRAVPPPAPVKVGQYAAPMRFALS
jgi:hypothetical protein